MRDASEWTAATSRESIRANQSGGNQAIVNVPKQSLARGGQFGGAGPGLTPMQLPTNRHKVTNRARSAHFKGRH